MSITQILWVRNCIHITAILYFHLELMSKSINPKRLGQLKNVEMSWKEDLTCLFLCYILSHFHMLIQGL